MFVSFDEVISWAGSSLLALQRRKEVCHIHIDHDSTVMVESLCDMLAYDTIIDEDVQSTDWLDGLSHAVW